MGNTAKIIRTALGEEPADLVLRGGRVVNVFTGEILAADVAVTDGRIAGVGSYLRGRETVELEGRFVAPGFINAHCHVESSMAVPKRYCQEELRHGVTTLITDPHEIANVAGLAGVRYMLDAVEDTPMNYYVQLPSCVPSTNFEHSGSILSAEALLTLRDHPRVLGLGEMMNYPGLAACDSGVLAKLEAFRGKVLDGHAPSLSGHALQAYAAAGIRTDHESVTWQEAREKLRAGIAVLVREGSASRNLEDLITGALEDGVPTTHMAFCTDDKHLSQIRREGTIRYNIRRAVALGMPPAQAIGMGTLNAARIYGLSDLGAVAPGYRADLVILEDLTDFGVHTVYKDGVAVVTQGEVHLDQTMAAPPEEISHSVRLPELTAASLALPARPNQPVIVLQPGQIVTGRGEVPGAQVAAEVAAGRLRKVAVVERHHATGHVGVGLLAGYGLRHGAVATTVAHDCHNLIVVGDNDEDMLLAARETARMEGGYCLVRDGAVVGSLPLPVAGLMSPLPAEALIAALDAMLEQARDLGVAPGIDPFITLSFLALPVIPSLRVTDLGLFDVDAFQFIL